MIGIRIWTLAGVLALLAGCVSPRTEVRREGGGQDADDSRYLTDADDHRPRNGGAAEYVVQPGDNLFRIAFRHQVSVDELVAWNQILNPDRIFVGQRLVVAPARLRPPPVDLPDPDETGTRLADTPSDAPPADTAAVASQTDPQTGVVTSGVTTAAVSEVAATPVPLTVSEPERPGSRPPAPAPATAPAAEPLLSTANLPDAEATMPAPTLAQSVPPLASASQPEPAPTTPLGSGAAPTATRNGWSWPLSGRLVGTFVAGDSTRSGLDITGTEGQAIHAAADGEVVYSGTGILGYGELIVIQHPNGLLSAYGHNRKRLVAEGAKLKRGQQIAEMGRDPAGRQLLHFEIRKNGKPVDPLAYLPGR